MDGSIFPATVLLSRIESGGTRLLQATVRDITEQKQHLERLTALSQQLARSNRELQDFAYIASHDLQEPLRKITSFGDRLKSVCSGQMNEQAADYLARMLNAAGRMQELINALLEYSRVTTQAKPFELVDLNVIAREVLSDLEVRVAETGGKVTVGELPKVTGDPMQLRQLLQNLIGNALKYCRPDVAPLVTVEGMVIDGRAEIRVGDNGIGIEEQYYEKIFGMFQRLHGKGEYEGTGVGLTICKKIVERHGGSISVQGRLGQGTVFIVTLPGKCANETYIT
jgi:light-regulated signal transduction histidine kinase (bacteriophytochrome)